MDTFAARDGLDDDDSTATDEEVEVVEEEEGYEEEIVTNNMTIVDGSGNESKIQEDKVVTVSQDSLNRSDDPGQEEEDKEESSSYRGFLSTSTSLTNDQQELLADETAPFAFSDVATMGALTDVQFTRDDLDTPTFQVEGIDKLLGGDDSSAAQLKLLYPGILGSNDTGKKFKYIGKQVPSVVGSDYSTNATDTVDNGEMVKDIGKQLPSVIGSEYSTNATDTIDNGEQLKDIGGKKQKKKEDKWKWMESEKEKEKDYCSKGIIKNRNISWRLYISRVQI